MNMETAGDFYEDEEQQPVEQDEDVDEPVDEEEVDTDEQPAAAEEPEQPAPAQAAQESDYEDSPVLLDLPPHLKAKAEELLDADLVQIIDAIAQSRAAQMIHVQAAQRRALRALNIPDEFTAEYESELMDGMTIVPDHLKGTREGARLAVTAAVHRRIQTTGDLAGEFERAARILRAANNQPPKAPAQKPIATQQVRIANAPTPRQPASSPGTTRARRGDFIKNHYGLTESEYRTIKEELGNG